MSAWQRLEIEHLATAGAKLRELGVRVGDASVAARIDRAVYEVGQAIYGANSSNPEGVREHIAAAVEHVKGARKIGAKYAELGVALIHLRLARRSVGKRG